MSYRFDEHKIHRREFQLLTPHPSSGTQYLPSSPIGKRSQASHDVQYARPNINGEWYLIGRSSTQNDLVIRSTNRLVSRQHVKLRYIEDQHACEVKCSGYNGCSLRSSGQTLYVRRDTGIMVQINANSADGGLILDITGSLVEIKIPEADSGEDEVNLLPMPSSPILQSRAHENDMLPVDIPMPRGIQGYDSIVSSSTPPFPAGILTPSRTPRTKRIKLLVRPDPVTETHDYLSSSPIRHDNHETHALQPCELNLLDSFCSDASEASSSKSCTYSCLEERGKENIPPVDDVAGYTDSLENVPREPQDVVSKPNVLEAMVDYDGTQVKEIDTGLSTLPDVVVNPNTTKVEEHETGLISPVAVAEDAETASKENEIGLTLLDVVAEEDATLSKELESDMIVSEVETKRANTPEVEESSVSASHELPEHNGESMIAQPAFPNGATEDDDGAITNDPEFIDMILTTLATSTISPAPIASIVPYFSPKTSVDQIEDFLRAQTAVSEVKRTGKDAAGRKLQSTWYYEPSDDSDELRRARLQALQKPVRSTKKRHHQYYWQPVHLRTAAPSNGLIDNRPKKKAKSKKQLR